MFCSLIRFEQCAPRPKSSWLVALPCTVDRMNISLDSISLSLVSTQIVELKNWRRALSGIIYTCQHSWCLIDQCVHIDAMLWQICFHSFELICLITMVHCGLQAYKLCRITRASHRPLRTLLAKCKLLLSPKWIDWQCEMQTKANTNHSAMA